MADAVTQKGMGDNSEEISAVPQTRLQHLVMAEDIEDDPHRAALELNPAVAEKVTWSTIFAVFVSRAPAGYIHSQGR